MSLLGQQGAGEAKLGVMGVERAQQAGPECVRQACGEAGEDALARLCLCP